MYSPFDVIYVPFPFTDRQKWKRRPALVLASWMHLSQSAKQVILVMITSLKNSAFSTDVVLKKTLEAGLKAPSIVRMKIATIDERLILRKVGRLALADQHRVIAGMKKLFPFLS